MYPTTTLFAHEDATSANNRPHFNGLSDQPLFKTGAKLVNDGFSLNEAWGYEWAENCLDSPPFTDGSDRKDEFTLHRREWANLNRLRTKHGRSGEIMHKWRITEEHSCPCDDDLRRYFRIGWRRLTTERDMEVQTRGLHKGVNEHRLKMMMSVLSSIHL